ncbi:MAG: aspartate--tRNA ligase, partial [Nitrospinota bacterium]
MNKIITTSYRTHSCGELTTAEVGKNVTLVGWVRKRRDHGGLVFIDLYDRYGVTQVSLNPQNDEESHELSHTLRNEFVLQVTGIVAMRPEGTINEKLTAGAIEINAKSIKVLNRAITPPFVMDENETPSELVRLKHRYMEIRRGPLLNNLVLRHNLNRVIRDSLNRLSFVDVETPILTKSTPEGARDFILPSRLNFKEFYALPQSPQLFKQLLMVGAIDRYYQIARCFRDEDLRADRQPEFTQLDMEMSFVNESDVQSICEVMFKELFQSLLDINLDTPFESISYNESMQRFGTDKPDLRFKMELATISTEVADSTFMVFNKALEDGGTVRGMAIPGGGSFSRKEIADIIDESIRLGAGGLAWIKVTEGGYQSSITKFFTPEILDSVRSKLQANVNDLM